MAFIERLARLKIVGRNTAARLIPTILSKIMANLVRFRGLISLYMIIKPTTASKTIELVLISL